MGEKYRLPTPPHAAIERARAGTARACCASRVREDHDPACPTRRPSTYDVDGMPMRGFVVAVVLGLAGWALIIAAVLAVLR